MRAVVVEADVRRDLRDELCEHVCVQPVPRRDKEVHAVEIAQQELELGGRLEREVKADDRDDHDKDVDHRPLAQKVEPRKGGAPVLEAHEPGRRNP